MDKTTLATFRIDKDTWKKFKKWASKKNSNASAELNQFILECLGVIDKNIEANIDQDLSDSIEKYIDNYLDTNLESYIDKYIDANIETIVKTYLDQVALKHLDTEPLALDISIDDNIDTNIDLKLDTDLDKEKPLAESLEEQLNEQLTNAELARRMNVSPSTVSRWVNQKSNPPKDLEWQYDPSLKKWVK